MKGVSFLYYTQEQIDRANQADLILFLQSQGEPLERAGSRRGARSLVYPAAVRLPFLL